MSQAPEGMIAVEEFARTKRITPDKAITMIRDGFYVGRKIGDQWYVEASELKGAAAAAKSSGLTPQALQPNKVSVVDIDMPFWSMVYFMIKLGIAAIPALIILAFVGTFIGTMILALVSSAGIVMR